VARLITFLLIVLVAGPGSAKAQQALEEPHVALNDVATAKDAHGVPALEARLQTTVLNGSDDSPVINTKVIIKNVSSNFYNYVTGWATFYDAQGVRCGEGAFKLDALAVNESAATDTPGLRLRCSPATWRIIATNLLTRSVDTAKPGEPTPPPELSVVSSPAEPTSTQPRPVNFIINIDGEEHPIQLNNPITLQMGNRERKIVLRSAP